MKLRQRWEILITTLYQIALRPRSSSEDSRRRELILNSILAGLTVVGLIALSVSVAYHLTVKTSLADADSLPLTTGFVAGLLLLWYLSRRGWYHIGVYSLLLLIGLGATNLAVNWSIELPGAELTYVLGIVIAGVLISGRGGLTVAALAAVVVVGLGTMQASGVLHPDVSWLKQPVRTGDAIGYAIILLVIGLVAWLANREIDRSLQRARASEAALKDERDHLEDRVTERTRQLEQTQLERMLELQRFAEFGRFSAGLLHDLVNPLMAASLNLEQLNEGPRSKLVKEASQSLRYLERYIDAARKQLQRESEMKSFAIGTELNQVVGILSHKAKAAAVKVTVRRGGAGVRLYGDPVKFSHLAANLIANAIEAYPAALPSSGPRQVVVEVTSEKTAVVLTVQDWGIGIASVDIPHLFDPFYTTKRVSSRSIGIGLVMVKQIIHSDFKGSIEVTSTRQEGTRFVARLHHGRIPKARS
jgi:signal transduction histidine kinase